MCRWMGSHLHDWTGLTVMGSHQCVDLPKSIHREYFMESAGVRCLQNE